MDWCGGNMVKPLVLAYHNERMVHRQCDPAARQARHVEAKLGPVAAHYEVRTLIRRGPHGSVWRADHRETAEEVAVKLLHERFASCPDVRDRLNREYHVLTAFLHPALVRLRDLTVGDEVALVTELVIGSDLGRLGIFKPGAATGTVQGPSARSRVGTGTPSFPSGAGKLGRFSRHVCRSIRCPAPGPTNWSRGSWRNGTDSPKYPHRPLPCLSGPR